MTGDAIFIMMEQFVKQPRRGESPFDPFIASETRDGRSTPLRLSYFKCCRLYSRAMKPLGPYSRPNLTGRINKLFYASKPDADYGWLWRFSDLKDCVSMHTHWDGTVVKKSHPRPEWYIRLNSIWHTTWIR